MASLEEYFADNPGVEPVADDSLNATDGQLEEILGRTGVSGGSQDEAMQTFAQLREQYASPIPGGGPLLEADDAAAFKAIEREVKDQKRLAKNREESRKHWQFVVDGAQFSVLEKSEDQSVWKQIFPPDVTSTPEPIPNKVLDVKNKMVSQILVDTPMPKPMPDGDEDRARVAQDLTRKFLRANGTPENMNDSELFHDALDMNMTGRSGFAYVWVDPMGGGWRPMQVKAHPRAEDPTHPLSAPKLDPFGQPITLPDGTVITERAVDPVLRYVAEDEQGQQTFTDNPSEAKRQWLPKMKRKLIQPSQVRTLPATADVSSAHGVILIMVETLDEVKARFPLVAAMPKPLLKKLVAWRPKVLDWKAIVPEALRAKAGITAAETGTDSESLSGDSLVFYYLRFARTTGDYQDGGEVAVSGANVLGKERAGFILNRDTLREDVDLDDGTTVPVLMDVPVAQWKGLNDVRGGDPFGVEPVSLFGGSNDIYSHLYLSILDAIDKGLHPNVYIPSTSTVSRDDYNRRDGTPLVIETPEDKPTVEPSPQLPNFTMDVLDRIDRAINSLAATNETSNGLDSPYAISGTAKQVAINQAKVGLRQLWQNTVNGCVRYWIICTKLAQAKITVPQQVQLTGTDSAYKARWWIGSDLVGVSRIALAPGSGTMMNPGEKAQWLAQLQQMKWVDEEQAGELVRASMSDDLGLPPNVHEEHINRCIADWLEGPPAGWEEQFNANQQAMQQYQQAQAAFQAQQQQQPQPTPGAQALGLSGAPVAVVGGPPAVDAPQPPQPPQLTPLSSPFEPRPNDEDPFVAKIHAGRLSRLMASADYKRFFKGWQQEVDKAYQRAFTNAGGVTVQQQQQAKEKQATEESFSKFKSDIESKVLSLVSTALAKVAAGEELGAGQPQEQPQPEGDNGLADVLSVAQDGENAVADRQHEAQQKALDRAHTSAENAMDRALELHKHAITSASKSHETALRARMTPPKPVGAGQPA